jgi:hypothetical protein
MGSDYLCSRYVAAFFLFFVCLIDGHLCTVHSLKEVSMPVLHYYSIESDDDDNFALDTHVGVYGLPASDKSNNSYILILVRNSLIMIG